MAVQRRLAGIARSTIYAGKAECEVRGRLSEKLGVNAGNAGGAGGAKIVDHFSEKGLQKKKWGPHQSAVTETTPS